MGIPDYMMNFIGFDSSAPRFVFIGIEEWAPKNTVCSEFVARLKTERSIVDLHDNDNAFSFIKENGRKQATWWSTSDAVG